VIPIVLTSKEAFTSAGYFEVYGSSCDWWVGRLTLNCTIGKDEARG
jgi:hypothetical protein